MAVHAAGPSVTVVGAGMVGLSVAWFLQEQGAAVTVLDAAEPNAGASWGNAGWIAPALTAPLPSPGVLRYGLGALLSPTSPLYVPWKSAPGTWLWLARFSRNCTAARWHRAQAALSELNASALSAIEELTDAHPTLRSAPAEPFTIALTSSAGVDHVLTELEELRSLGQPIKFDLLTATELHSSQPGLSPSVHAGVRLHDQRFIDPTSFVPALARAVAERGGVVRASERVDAVADQGPRVAIRTDASRIEADHVVLATGAALGTLGRPHGIRTRVQSGRGYSFTVPTDTPVPGPIYFPELRIACTPLEAGLRVAGMMEFRPQHAPIDRRRLQTLANTLAQVMPTARIAERTDEWVGARPCTADGLPLIGATRSPRIHAAGGHGMWGIALGPATGSLLARAICGTDESPVPRAFDPLR